MIDWNKEFPITSVTREDLVSAGFAKQVIAELSDDGMREIAAAMEDIYCDHGYREDLERCTKRILKRRNVDAVLVEDEQTTGEQHDQLE